MSFFLPFLPHKMKNVLATFQNIPVSSAAIVSIFPNIKAKSAKISQLEKANEIIRLKRNLFVTNPEESGLALSTGLIANHLLAPSYVSQQTALRHYGLIPEAVYTTQSMTLKAAKTFNTAIGFFLIPISQKRPMPLDFGKKKTATPTI